MADTLENFQAKYKKKKKKDEGCPPASEFRSFLPEKVEREEGKGERAATTTKKKHLKRRKCSKMAFKVVSFHVYIRDRN